MDGERVVVDRRLEDVPEEAARTREEASQAAKAGLGQKWDSGECFTETGGALQSVLYQSQCYTKASVMRKGHSGMEEGDVVEFRHKNMHLFCCLFVCLFFKRKF